MEMTVSSTHISYSLAASVESSLTYFPLFFPSALLIMINFCHQGCHLIPFISCLKMPYIWEHFSATDLSRFHYFETSLHVITNNHAV